jgi:hypothetical protein
MDDLVPTEAISAERSDGNKGMVGRILTSTDSDTTIIVPRDTLPMCSEGLDLLLDGRPAARLYPEALGYETIVHAGVPQARLVFRFPLSTFASKASRSAITVRRVWDGAVLNGSGLFPKTTRRKQRGLVLIPAGARWSHRSVELYQTSWENLVGKYFNVGDMMVYDSTLKILDYDNLDVAKIGEFDENDVKRYNEQFDFCFLRGSNYIHEHMRWENMRGLLERLRIPVYAIGVGAQAERMRKLNLSQDSIGIWKMIAERSGSIGVRGEFSAECLNDIGIRNVEVVGCPSLFRQCERTMQLRVKPPREVRRIAFSLRREVNAVYSEDPKRYLATQREAMLRMNVESDLTVTIHGEPEEKAFFFKDRERMETATASLTKSGWLTPETTEDVLRIYRNQLYLYTRADNYDEFVKDIDFAIGYRVHGILPALANGIPGAMVNYDSRSEELSRTHHIPLVSEEDMATKSWRDIYTELDFVAFQKAFTQGYDRMKSFMDQNGIPSLL